MKNVQNSALLQEFSRSIDPNEEQIQEMGMDVDMEEILIDDIANNEMLYDGMSMNGNSSGLQQY